MSVVYILMAGREYDGCNSVCVFSDKSVADEYCERMKAHNALAPEWDEGLDQDKFDAEHKAWKEGGDFPASNNDFDNMFYVETAEARL